MNQQLQALTDEEIVAIRDDHLPNQGERFDCIAFARAVLARAGLQAAPQPRNLTKAWNKVRAEARAVQNGGGRMSGLLTAVEDYADLRVAARAQGRGAVPPAGAESAGLLSGALQWVERSPHGDNCGLSSPDDLCDCGKESLVSALESALQLSLDERALATAREIALMWGRDRSQFVSKIQCAVIDAMRWAAARGIDSGEAGQTPQAAGPEGQEPGPKDAPKEGAGIREDVVRRALGCIERSTEYRLGNPAYEHTAALLRHALQVSEPKADEARELRDALPYGIIDPDYARIFTIARVLAWSEGYALAMHGSFTRDLDLVAIPWTEAACAPEKLVRRIEDAAGLKLSGHPPGVKPHGRLAWTLVFPAFNDPRFVDLSIMPLSMYDAAMAKADQPQQQSTCAAIRPPEFPVMPLGLYGLPSEVVWSEGCLTGWRMAQPQQQAPAVRPGVDDDHPRSYELGRKR